jgi:hypothetical protein
MLAEAAGTIVFEPLKEGPAGLTATASQNIDISVAIYVGGNGSVNACRTACPYLVPRLSNRTNVIRTKLPVTAFGAATASDRRAVAGAAITVGVIPVIAVLCPAVEVAIATRGGNAAD